MDFLSMFGVMLSEKCLDGGKGGRAWPTTGYFINPDHGKASK